MKNDFILEKRCVGHLLCVILIKFTFVFFVYLLLLIVLCFMFVCFPVTMGPLELEVGWQMRICSRSWCHLTTSLIWSSWWILCAIPGLFTFRNTSKQHKWLVPRPTALKPMSMFTCVVFICSHRYVSDFLLVSIEFELICLFLLAILKGILVFKKDYINEHCCLN